MSQNDEYPHFGLGVRTANNILPAALTIVVISIFTYGCGGLWALALGVLTGLAAIKVGYAAVITVAVGISAGLSAAAGIQAVPIIVSGAIGCGGVTCSTILSRDRDVKLPKALAASTV